MQKDAVFGIDRNSAKPQVDIWSGCVNGKQSRISFKAQNIRGQAVRAVIHSDVCGPMSVKPIGGSSYIL